MLLEFVAKNWRSFDELNLSMVASDDIDDHSDRLIRPGPNKMKLLPAAAIFGANNFGKSNFLDALKFVKKMIDDPWSGEPCVDISMNMPKPIEFFISMAADGIVYELEFAVTKITECFCEIVEERLYIYEDECGTPLTALHTNLNLHGALQYIRNKNGIQLHEKFKTDKALNAKAGTIDKGQLFLHAFEPASGVCAWFKNLVFLSADEREKLLEPENKIYIVDDLDLGYHPNLTRHIVDTWFYLRPPTSQLIFTTHDAMLMDRDLFRVDEMFIVDRGPEKSFDGTKGVSEIYGLDQFKDIHNDEDIRHSYMQGRFGGVPRV